jgi:hypothetical protein
MKGGQAVFPGPAGLGRAMEFGHGLTDGGAVDRYKSTARLWPSGLDGVGVPGRQRHCHDPNKAVIPDERVARRSGTGA